MSIRKGVKDLVAEAMSRIRTLDTAEAIALAAGEDVVLVDLRDIRERRRDGFIPGSFHAPRGMLEFWVDPDSPYYKEIFGTDCTFVFYCASGWRSALATAAVKDMGMENVAHVGGGFNAWKKADGPMLITPDGREPT
jgi:rhodanese-related sulfurtransferase